MKKVSQYISKQLSEINQVLEANTWMYSFLGSATSFITLVGFRPLWFIEQDEPLIKMFFIPITIWIFLYIVITVERGPKNVLQMFPQFLSKISFGHWMGMIAVGVITLGEWFSDPENGKLEPYFIATTLCAAASFSAFKKLDSMIKD